MFNMPGANHYEQYDDAAQFSEDDWVAGLTARDKTVIALCYDRYAPALYGYILKSVNVEATASGILSAAFLEIIRGIESFVPGDIRLFTWMLRITHREILLQTGDPRELPLVLRHLPGGI